MRYSMSKDFNIGKGPKFDLSSVPKSDISIEELDGKDKKLLSIFTRFDLNKDGNLSSIELAQAFKTFTSFDNIESDGILSKNELKDGASSLNTKWQLSGNEKIKFKDIKNFIEQVLSVSNGSDKVDISELLPFTNLEFSIENVVNAETRENNDQQVCILSYPNSKQILLNQDKSYQIVDSSNESKFVKTTSFASNNIKLNEQIRYSNGDIETYNYIFVDGEYFLSDIEQVTGNGKVKSKSQYINGVCTQEIVEKENTRLVYAFVGDSLKLCSSEKFDSNGRVIETVDYEYNDDNSCFVKIKRNNTEIEQLMYDPKNPDSVYHQKVIEYSENGDVVEETGFTADGNLLKTKSSSGCFELICYAPDGKNKEYAYKILGDKEYFATYDGNGNTNLVVRFGEDITNVADAVGISVDELYDFNSDIVKGKCFNRYFLAGQVIRLPGELEPDNKILANRGTPEQEELRFAQWQTENQQAKLELELRESSMPREFTSEVSTFKQLAKVLYENEGITPSSEQIKIRVNELKDLNKNLTDGSLKGKKVIVRYNSTYEHNLHTKSVKDYQTKYNNKSEKEAAIGSNIAKRLHDYIDNHSFALKDADFKKILQEITPDNVVGFLEQYDKLYSNESFSNFVRSEYGGGQQDVFLHVFNMLKKRALKSGINSTNLNNLLQKSQIITASKKTVNSKSVGESYEVSTTIIDIDKFEQIKSQIISQIKGVESISPEERKYDAYQKNNNISTLIDTAGSVYDIANSSFNHQLESDGWCADLWEGLKFVSSFGANPNLDENVRKELDFYRNSMADLKKVYETQGEDAFKKAYEKTFGVVYDSNLVKSYSIKLANYNNALAIDDLFKKMNSSFVGNHDLRFCSYNELKNYLQTFLKETQQQKQIGEQQVESVLKSFMDGQGVGSSFDSGDVEKKSQYLRLLCQKIQQQLINGKNILTGSKDLDTVNIELVDLASSLYGAKHDIMHRVDQYLLSQKKGDAYVSVGVKALSMIGIGLITGGSGFTSILLSGAGTFATSSAVDITNEWSGDGLTRDELMDICKDSSINALFAMGSTGVREFVKPIFKNQNFANFKTSVVAATGQTGVMSVSSAVKDQWSTGNAALDFGFAFMANYITGKPFIDKAKVAPKVISLKNFNPGRASRRGFSFGKNEIKEASKNVAITTGVGLGIKVLDTPQSTISNYLSQINNLGDLNRLYTSVYKLQSSQLPNQNEVLAMIKNRAKELMADSDYSVLPQDFVLTNETKTNALLALEQPTMHLRQEQIDDITAYVKSLSSVTVLYNVVEKLNKHNFEINENPKLYQALNDKFAELRCEPPYKTANDFLLANI